MDENKIKIYWEKILNKETLTQEELQSFSEELLKIDGVPEIIGLLALSDDDFAMVAPVVLDTIEEDLSKINTRLNLIQLLQANNIDLTVKDIDKVIYQTIDTLPTGDEATKLLFSDVKKTFLKAIAGFIFDAVNMTRIGHSRLVNVFIQKLNGDTRLPEYKHLGDAGMDIYAAEDVEILPGEQKIVPTGFKVAIPKGYALLVQPRSGLSARTKLRIANTPGLIDAPYRDEVGVIVENIEPAIKDIDYEFENGRPVIQSILHGSPINIAKGERFAQLRLVEAPIVSWIEVGDVNVFGEDRGGGFGSTGQ